MRKEDMLETITNTMRAREERIGDMIKECERLRGLQQRDLVRYHELSLLKDIRDGKLLVLHAHDMSPATIAVFDFNKNEQGAA